MKVNNFISDWNRTHTSSPSFQNAIEWARKKAIDEARKWFADYLMEIGYQDDWMRDSTNMESGEERFIKAMGE